MKWRTKLRRARGQGKTEYVLLVLLIGVAAIAIVGLYGDNIRDLFATSDNSLAGDENAVADTSQAEGTEGGGLGGPGATNSGGQGDNLGSSQDALSNDSSRAGDTPGKTFGGVKGKGDIAGHNYKSKEWGDEAGKEDDGKKVDTFVGVEQELLNESGELAKIGGENANVRFGSADVKSTARAGYHDGNVEAGVNLEAQVAAIKAQANHTIGDENGTYGKGTAEGAVLSAKANVDASVAVGKDGVSAKVEGGAEANLVEGKVSAEGGFKIPSWVPVIGDAQVTMGGGVSGQVGASAKGHATAQANKDGISFGLGAKAALGLGAGFDFSFGIKFN